MSDPSTGNTEPGGPQALEPFPHTRRGRASAHVDTTPGTRGDGVTPIVHRAHDGSPIVLSGDTTQIIDPADTRAAIARGAEVGLRALQGGDYIRRATAR